MSTKELAQELVNSCANYPGVVESDCVKEVLEKEFGGVEVPDGTYYFEVQAYNAAGEQVAVQEYCTGIVQGVKMSNGILYFDIGEGVVSSEYVYSVRDPNLSGGEGSEGSEGGSGSEGGESGGSTDNKKRV